MLRGGDLRGLDVPRTGRVQITITGRRRPSLDGKSGRHPGLSQRQARQSSKGEGPQRQTQSPILVTGATQDAALGRARVLVAANLTVVTLQNAHEFLGQLLFRRHPGGFFGGLERDLHVVVVADGLDGGLAGRRRSSVAGSFSSVADLSFHYYDSSLVLLSLSPLRLEL